MDDITWPPKKRPDVKIVPERQSEPNKISNKITLPDNEPEPEEAIAMVENQNDQVDETKVEHNEPEQKMDVEPPKDGAVSGDDKPPKKHHKLLFFKHMKLSKKMWALVIAGAVLLIGGGAVGAWKLYKHFTYIPPQPPQAIVEKKPEPEPPKTEASKLTGIQVDPAMNLRPVTGVMIENSPDARPQSGLKDAGIVYEAIAEGGITRFLALYQEARPDYIGPVRSVRPYYLDFLMPFDASIAHAGGSTQGLADIKTFGVKDLDQFANSGAYRRVSNRFAPHNLYTDFDSLDALNSSKGFTSSTFTGFERGEEKVAEAVTAKIIDFSISSSLYNVHYEYNTQNNSYLRNEGGSPHRDEKSGSQLEPKVVIALVMTRGIASDGQHTDYGTTGSGHMFVFQNGVVTEGTWSKPDRKSQFSFKDAAGAALALNPGQTWISIVDANSDVQYTP